MAKAKGNKPQVDEASFNSALKKKAVGAFKKARTTDAKPRGSRLPGDLVGAIAQLVNVKFGFTEKTRDPYFMLMGVVKKPEQYRGISMNIGHFLNPTENKTVDEKIEQLVSDCKLLEMPIDETTEVGNLLGIIKDRVKERPFFEFNTWKPDNGDTMCFLQGTVSDFVDDEVSEETIADDAATEAVAEEVIEEEAPKPSPKPKPKPAATKPAAAKPTAKPAAKPATKPSKPAPVEEEVLEEEVVDEEPAAEEERVPQVDDVFDFKLKPDSDVCDVAITRVDEEARVVDIKFTTGPNAGKSMKNLKWERLGA